MHQQTNATISLPQIGFGMWELGEAQASVAALRSALDAGYRHFDTAQIYGNEQILGDVLAEHRVDRSEVFITTKIWNEQLDLNQLGQSIDESLAKLRTDHVDLLLVHYPVEDLYRDAWRALEAAADDGRFRHVGVSNFSIDHLEALRVESSFRPAVNQVELHVFLQERGLLAYCRANDILVQAYSPLAHGLAFGDKHIGAIAAKHGKSEAQVMIRWLLEHDLIVIVKSASERRMRENLDVHDFSLDPDDLAVIAGLDRSQRVGWGPDNARAPIASQD